MWAPLGFCFVLYLEVSCGETWEDAWWAFEEEFPTGCAECAPAECGVGPDAWRDPTVRMCVRPVSLAPGAARGRTVPCGQCIDCRLRRKREWAMRCVHEASLYQDNRFVTLTYADEFLPAKASLDRRAFPLFMKRLRKELGPVRFFHAGEYGEENGRPHYHALLFGMRFPDECVVGETEGGEAISRSLVLLDLWGQGRCQIGSVTFESAAYVAGYCVKKVTGARAKAHYAGREPEYATMSRRPGIGFGWFSKFREEVYRHDSVVTRGHECGPPRYYDKKLEELDAASFEVMKARRLRKYERCDPVTWRQRAARELIAMARLKLIEERK